MGRAGGRSGRRSSIPSQRGWKLGKCSSSSPSLCGPMPPPTANTAQREDHLVHVPWGDKLERNVNGLPLDVKVRARQCTQHGHDQLHHEVHDVTVCRSELVEPVEHNELHIVVTLGEEQLAIGVGGCADRGGGRGKGQECAGALVAHRSGRQRGVKQRDDNLDVPPLLCPVRPAHLPDQIEHHHLRSLQGSWSLAVEEKRRCWRLGSHRPLFSYGCFDYYTSYWFRWDSSPDRELIHQAIEAFNGHLASSEKRRQQPAGKGNRRRKRRSERAKAQPEKKGKGKRKPGKEKTKASPGGGGGAGDEGPSTVMVPYVEEEEEEEAEKIYHAELVLADEVWSSRDDAGSEGEQEEDGGTGLELVAMSPSQQQQQGSERSQGWRRR